MFGFCDSRRNKINLSQLLTSYQGERGIDDDVKNFLPGACREALYGNYGAGTVSGVRNGSAYARFKKCADILDEDKVTEIFNSWIEILKNVKAFDGDNRQQEIKLFECARRIINGSDKEILQQNCSKLFDWLKNALNLYNESYLQKIFAVLTILAITRDKPDNSENWKKICALLEKNDFLPTLNALPDNPSLKNQRAFENCKNFFLQGDSERAQEFLNKSLDKDKPLWNSEVYRQLALLPICSPTDALEFFRKARKIIENALTKKLPEAEYKDKLMKQWQKISSEYLEKTITFFDDGGANFIKDFEKPLSEEKFCRRWHGEACFRLAQFFHSRDEKISSIWLNRGVEVDNNQAMNLLMEKLWPLDAQDIPNANSKAYKLADKLQNSPFPQISGGAHYRLYLAAQNLKKANQHLRAAYNCDFAPAVRKYNAGIVSYCEKISRSTCEWSGKCLLNVPKDDSLAKIFAKTAPENWSITCTVDQKIFYDVLKNLGDEQMICLLISDDEQKNLADFLFVMEMLEKPPSDSIILIRGAQERLTPIIDSGLKQYFHGGQRPLLRVEILDDELDAARELFSKCPLFLPLLKIKDLATIHFVAVGTACQYLTNEASWLLTFPDDLKIAAKISAFTIDEISNELVTLTKQAIITGELLYFAVDTGDDLRTLSLGIKIRKLLTRVWLKYSAAPVPPATPIAVRIKNPDFAFMSQRLIVLGTEASGGCFNRYLLTSFGSHLRYTWGNLVNNIYSRLALAVHMVYFNVHAGENFSDADCQAAFNDFSSRTYNQRSSLTVAQSLLYRLFVMSRLLDFKIFDDDLTNIEDLFSVARKNFFTNKTIINLEKFSRLLEKIQEELSTLQTNLNESHCLKGWQELSKILEDFIEQEKLSSHSGQHNVL